MLFDGPDLAVFDEGHRLKNDRTRAGRTLRHLATRRFPPSAYSHWLQAVGGHGCGEGHAKLVERTICIPAPKEGLGVRLH
jgi:hypothetical protein